MSDDNDDWRARPGLDDTTPELGPSDLLELDEAAETPPRGVETLAGYELGRRDERAALFQAWDEMMAQERHMGAAAVLQAVRDHLASDGARGNVIDEIVEALARRAGIELV